MGHHDNIELLSGVKACKDCAHYQQGDICGAAVFTDPVSGDTRPASCFGQRVSLVSGDCGQKAMKFLPTAAYEAARVVRRIQLARAIEDGISRLNPDGEEAQEILDALTESLKGRYEDNALDALAQAESFRGALEELEAPAECPISGAPAFAEQRA